LIDAGVEQASALAAVTSGDNSNIMTARVGRETFGVSRVVARIYDPRRAEIYQRLGIPTVATVSWTTDQVLRRLMPERRPTEWTDGTGNIVLVERNLPATWAGKSFGQLAENGGFTIVAVTRTGTAKLAEPSMVGQQDDILHVVVESDRIDDFDARLNETQSVGGH